MATIKFILRSIASPAQIYVRIRKGRDFDYKIPTGLYINTQLWNPTKGRPRSSANSNNVAFQIDALNEKILSFLNKSSSENKSISAEDLRELITPTLERNVESIDLNLLVNYFESYIDELKNRVELGKIQKSTVNKYEVIKNNILEFEKKIGKKISVSDVDLNLIRDFELFCKNHYKHSKGTIGRRIRFIKTVCRHARINGVETSIQLDAIKGYEAKSSFIYLNETELKSIESLVLDNPSLDGIRDWLLISAYTAQRVSDFLRFKKSMIYAIKGDKGKEYKALNFIQKKTGKEMNLPLDARVLPILEKRGGDFPKETSAKNYNELIKVVAKMAGLTELIKGAKINKSTLRKEEGEFPKWELVTSHIGRRSFASNNYGKLPTPLIMYATGHSTEQMLLKYIGKTNDTKALELAKLLNQ